jgi:hypothetical protein
MLDRELSPDHSRFVEGCVGCALREARRQQANLRSVLADAVEDEVLPEAIRELSEASRICQAWSSRNEDASAARDGVLRALSTIGDLLNAARAALAATTEDAKPIRRDPLSSRRGSTLH